MNDFYLGKLEACITLSNGDDKKFIRHCKKAFDMTTDEVLHDSRMWAAIAMMWEGEDIQTIVDAVI